MTFPKIFKVTSEQWRRLSEDKKSEWHALANVKRESAMGKITLHIAIDPDDVAVIDPRTTWPQGLATIRPDDQDVTVAVDVSSTPLL
ncbi:hypothetical protein N7539_008755 [Penicillium diatomitis]|uniref:Uncharacterized protein n=1 Tax=Penicillium diatomitis TaxID=2819901 RepID=A0A9W9WR93_9EURO|nr:uncharacterized protein N7539_008755 [Penicillium diatomitis]KAJ5471812.1 hypothetical protein N7539_008755 [Penicillium diatomitis]